MDKWPVDDIKRGCDCRFVYRCPLKSIPFRLASAFLPELIDLPAFNDKQAPTVLKRIGGQPEKRLMYTKSFILHDDYILLDERLGVKEEADCLARIRAHPEKYSIKDYHERKDRFGTIAMFTKLAGTQQQVYQTYKGRMAIKVMFDGMKNVMNADYTYMQDDQTLQGWMFINHIVLQWYQHLYIELKEKELLKKISVNDYVQLLTYVRKVKINDTWHLNEFTNQAQKLVGKLNIKLT